MSRDQMIMALEEYWYKFYADNPEEPEGDIPCALQYYRELPLWELKEEYNSKCM